MINVTRACRRPHSCVRCVSSAAVPRGAHRRPFHDDQSMASLRLKPKSARSQPRGTAAACASLGPDAGADGLAASLSDLRASIAQAAADQQHAQAAAAEAARLSEAAELAHAEAAAASRKARASAHKASLAAQTAAAVVAETPSPSGGAAALQPTPGGRASGPPAATSAVSASKLDAAQPASAGSKGVLPSPEVPEADQAAAAGPASEVPASDPTQVTRQDQIWMHRALQLARRGLGVTAPNPAVGCVIVSADGERVVGEGYHPKAGEPHAEVFALRAAGRAAAGATAYVTLEPCNHFGRTPPCALALIAAGVARVVVGVQDPNPLVGGGGLQTLRDAGIPVAVPCEEEFCWEINRKFMERMATAA